MKPLQIQNTGHIPDTGLCVQSLTIEKIPHLFSYRGVYGPGKDITFDTGMERFLELFKKESRKWAHHSDIEKLYLTLKWLKNIIKFDNKAYPHVYLSEVMKNGKGVCRHIALLYLIFLQEIGISGVFLNNGMGTSPKNIHRPNGYLLFHHSKLYSRVSSHAWGEVYINGSWIPVDPTIDFIGDTPEKIKVFQKAEYQAAINPLITTEPTSIYGYIDISPFHPQQKQATGKVIVKPVPQMYWTSHGYHQTTPYQGNFSLKIFPITYDNGVSLVLHKEKQVSAQHCL